MFRIYRGVGFVALALVLGLTAGYWWGTTSSRSLIAAVQSSLLPIQLNDTSLTLVHPLLAYRTPEATTYGEYESLKASLQSVVDKSGASRVSIYFRDLNNARWIGIDQNDTYYPASLLKVPVMIAYYKQAEQNPGILNEPIVYQKIVDDDPFDAASTLVVGKVYTIEQLIEYMIIDSDNGAAFTLLARINPDVLSAVYTALGITNPGEDTSTYQISNRTYALFFRILYNATYLSPEYSERALKLLSRASFHDGLVAGVPDSVIVAHKFGEHILNQGSSVTGVELHDCGVVYYPEHPYLLCVMTSAQDISMATNLLSSISKVTYDGVKKEYAGTN